MSFLFSLKRALTVNFLVVAAVPVLLFGLFTIQLISSHQLDGVRERNATQARSIADEVDSFLLEVRSDLRHVEQVLSTKEILQPGRADDFLANMVRNSRFFESIYLLDDQYRVVSLGVLPKLLARSEDFIGLDFSGHQLFRSGEDLKMPVWSNTFVSLVTGEPSVTLGVPMPGGFLLGNIRLSSLGKLLQRYSSAGIEVSIIDQGGTLVAHNVTKKAMQRLNFGGHPAVVSAMEGVESTREFKQGPLHNLESVSPVLTSGWVVWVGLDMHFILAPINDIRDLLIFFMVIAVSLASIIALFNVQRLMTPLIALGDRTKLIADGLYDFRFRPSGFVEIDELANQIASMTHAIKMREESIVTNEQRFRDLVNSIDGIVWEMEYPSFRFLFVSKQAETILGYPLQDWYEVESFWEQKTHAEDLAQAKSYCQLMSEKHEDHDFEYRMIAADGRIVWIRDLVTVVVEDCRPVRLLGVMIDVTEQKELLDDLSRSEQNYREIFNATSDAIFIHDSETGQVLDVNQSMLKMHNTTYEAALVGGMEAISQGEGPYSMEAAKLKLQFAREHGSCAFEWHSRKATGEYFWTDVNLRRAMIGNQSRIIATVRDISDRKEAAEKLREANESLLLLINRMPIGCIFWSPEFTVNMWNPAAEAIFGFTEEEMVGCSPLDTIVAEELRGEMLALWPRLMSGDTSAHSVNDNLTKAGKTIICEWYNTPVNDLSGEIIGVISMVQDVSDRKAAEKELERYRHQLEDLVRQRTEQLEKTQQELVQKERLAVLGQLTATVSHEIRNPLGTVANSLYLLKDALPGDDFPHLARPLQLAERNVERCDSIISDLLDFSRQRTIEKEAVAIDEWLAELLDELSFPSDVNCHWLLNSKAVALVDSERLRRVMVNVITNALQAMDEASVVDKSLEIITMAADGRCEINVCDTGVGMSEEVMSRIFEPMFSTKNFGVGLGVPIIMNIMEGHGGGAIYQSSLDRGTTVKLWLPSVLPHWK
ncbi:PAS domain S-box protein [Deltaproteobacteria bacterium IMCC39524]|nr:PAS domain S-box protein [Deltaproteobacteria bacterium IMCC39524]